MAAVNSVQSALHLPLTGLATPRVLMCSASMGAEGSVTLQLREAVQAPEPGSSLDTALTIGYPDPEILADVLGTLQAAALNTSTGTTTNSNISSNCGSTISSNSSTVVTSSNTGASCNNIGNSKSPTTNSVGSCTTGNSSLYTNAITSTTNTRTSLILSSNNSSNSCSSVSSNSSSCSSSNESTTVPVSLSSSSSSSSSPTSSASSTSSNHPPIVVKKTRPKTSSPTRHGPQQCQVCSKVFGNASALAKHKLTHSDERKYVCAMCSKAFKRQDHLNGHMLTHRNKKPYECKAEGCGKSYCDARSLRRHTENHHSSSAMTPTTPNQSMSPSTGPPTGLSLSPATASGDASSPHGATCVQYSISSSGGGNASSDFNNSKPSSPSSPAGSGNGTGNEGLTRQQLDLISQIMQQTKQASTQVTISANHNNGMKSYHQARPRTWNMQTQLQQNHAKISSSSGENVNSMGTTTVATGVASTTTSIGNQQQLQGQQQQHEVLSQQQHQLQLGQHQQQQQQIIQPHQTTHALNIVKIEQKPVECNLCHRKFKNIPALNGHMRLHGGYFKKDTESKKNEKKETPGPPLQTASIGVRALIEEKIISKRSKDLKGAFVVPAAPLTSAVRRLAAEAEGFLTPKTPTILSSTVPNGSISISGSTNSANSLTTANISQGTTTTTTIATSMQVQKQIVHKVANLNGTSVGTHHQSTGTDTKDATLIELLKRGTKVAVKRTCSDPGQIFTTTTTGTNTNANTQTVLMPSDGTLSAPNTPTTTPPLAISLPGGEATPVALTISQTQNASGDVFTLTYATDSSTAFFGESDMYSVSDTAMLLQAVDSIQLLNDSTTGTDQLEEIASLSDYSLGAAGDSCQMGDSKEYRPTSRQLQAVLNSPLPESLAEFSALHSKDYVLYNCTSNESPATQSTASPLPSPLAYPTPPASHEAVAQASPFLDDSHHFSDAKSFFDEKSNTDFIDDNQSQFLKTSDTSDLTESEKILKLKNELFNESKSVLAGGQFFRSEENSSDVFGSDVKVEDLLNENNNEQCDLKDFNHQNLSFLDETQSFLDDAQNTNSPLSASFFSTTEVTSVEDVKQVLNDVLPQNNSSATLTDEVDGNPCQNDIDLYYLPGLTLQSQMMSNSDDPLLSSSPKDFGQRTVTSAVQTGPAPPAQLQTKPQVQISTTPYNGPTPAKRIRTAAIGEEVGSSVQVGNSSSVISLPKDNQIFLDNSCATLHKPATGPTAVQSAQTTQQPSGNTLQHHNYSSTFQTSLSYSNSVQKRKLKPPPIPKKLEVYRSKLRRPSTTHYTPPPILNPDRRSSGLYSCLPKTQIQETASKLEEEFEENPILSAFLDDSKVNIGTAYQAMIPNLETEMNFLVDDKAELMWNSSESYDANLLTRFIELSKSYAVPSGYHSEEVALKALLDAQGQTHVATLTLLQTPSSRVHLSWCPKTIEMFLKGLEKYGKDFYRIACEVEGKTTSDCIQLYYLWKKLCPEYKNLILKQELADHDEASTSSSTHATQSPPENRPHVCEMPDCSASITEFYLEGCTTWSYADPLSR
ncbi:serine-rich adhesin for platelets isoform X2 [Hermetia illucens]|uniref:serine-rich adhesin for platelets isoform X2 n=1 Tax=Hermetia illucens TaxID=343691 RepID=UPI0018CC6203|nr:serine-rich adhesin for platelets isoform X2 [Hermetia illucens]